MLGDTKNLDTAIRMLHETASDGTYLGTECVGVDTLRKSMMIIEERPAPGALCWGT